MQKYFRSRLTQITSISPAVSPPEGRLAIVTNAGRDAMDVAARETSAACWRTVKSCRSDAPMLASSLRRRAPAQPGQTRRQSAGDGGKQARSPGRARRKPLKPLRREGRVSRRTLGDYARVLHLNFAREAAGASGTRLSLCPLLSEGQKLMHNSDARRAARTRGRVNERSTIVIVHAGACEEMRSSS